MNGNTFWHIQWKRDLSQTLSLRLSKSCFSLHPSKQQEGRKKSRTSGISIQALYWYTSYILFLAPSAEHWLIDVSLPHQKINTVDRWRIYGCKKKWTSDGWCKKSLSQTSESGERGEQLAFLIVQIAPKKRYWIIFNLLGTMDKPAYEFQVSISPAELKWSESSHYSCRKCHFYR